MSWFIESQGGMMTVQRSMLRRVHAALVARCGLTHYYPTFYDATDRFLRLWQKVKLRKG